MPSALINSCGFGISFSFGGDIGTSIFFGTARAPDTGGASCDRGATASLGKAGASGAFDPRKAAALASPGGDLIGGALESS